MTGIATKPRLSGNMLPNIKTGGCGRDVGHGMNDGNTAYGALQSFLSSRGLWIYAKCLYECVIVPTAFFGAEAYGMRSAQ